MLIRVIHVASSSIQKENSIYWNLNLEELLDFSVTLWFTFSLFPHISFF